MFVPKVHLHMFFNSMFFRSMFGRACAKSAFAYICMHLFQNLQKVAMEPINMDDDDDDDDASTNQH